MFIGKNGDDNDDDYGNCHDDSEESNDDDYGKCHDDNNVRDDNDD